jgi:hypothetical protein
MVAESGEDGNRPVHEPDADIHRGALAGARIVDDVWTRVSRDGE